MILWVDEMSEEQTIPSLEALLDDMMHPNPRIQEEAAAVMAEHYPLEALPKLLALFCHDDPKVYRAAVKGIGFFGCAAFLPLIQHAYHYEHLYKLLKLQCISFFYFFS